MSLPGRPFSRRLIGNKFSVLEKIQAVVLGADPKISVGIFGDGADDIFRQAVARREQFPVLAVPTRQAVLRARPQLSVADLKQRENLRAENFRAGRGNEMIGLEIETSPSSRVPDPDLLLMIHQHRPGV